MSTFSRGGRPPSQTGPRGQSRRSQRRGGGRRRRRASPQRAGTRASPGGWGGSARGGVKSRGRLTAHLSGGQRGRASCCRRENPRMFIPRLVPPPLPRHSPPPAPPMPPLHTTSHPAPGVLLLQFNRYVLHGGLADTQTARQRLQR